MRYTLKHIVKTLTSINFGNISCGQYLISCFPYSGYRIVFKPPGFFLLVEKAALKVLYISLNTFSLGFEVSHDSEIFLQEKNRYKTSWNFLDWVRQAQFLHHKLLFYMAISFHMHHQHQEKGQRVMLISGWMELFSRPKPINHKERSPRDTSVCS